MSSWPVFELWVKAAFKDSTSDEFNQLSFFIAKDSLIQVLYSSSTNLQNYVNDAMAATKVNYQCKYKYCSYLELFSKQIGTAGVTLNPPNEILFLVPKSNTIQTWLPSRYLVPVEWNFYTSYPLPNPTNFINYDKFLSPGIVRFFYNSYFQGNKTATAQAINLPLGPPFDAIYVDAIYNYFISVIPGLKFFQKHSVSEFINGFNDTFASFVSNMSVYEGGNPIVNPFFNPTANVTEDNKPKHVVYSGRTNTQKTKSYIRYFNSQIINQYTTIYDEYSANKTRYYYKQLWPVNITIEGGSGSGTFGTEISDNDDISVFVPKLLRTLNLTYNSDLDYKGLEVSRFNLKPGLFNTSLSVPQNAIFSQNQNGYDGFMNISSQFGAPIFACSSHCYGCSNSAVNMIDYYNYSDGTYPSVQIIPSINDVSFADIEPFTGVGVRISIKYEVRVAFYNDYFFNGYVEPEPGKGVSFPFFLLAKDIALSQDRIDQLFGNLQFVRTLKKVALYAGVIFGLLMIVVASIVGILIYRIDTYGTWKLTKNSKSSLLFKYISLRETKENKEETQKEEIKETE